MWRKLFQTPNDVTALVLRLALAIVFFPQGAHIPAFFAFLAILAEFAGAIGLFFGLLGRVAAFGLAVEMIVAALMSHVHQGFFMNWMHNKAGEGFEFHLLAIAMALAVLIRGSGALSVDRWIATRRATEPVHPPRDFAPAH
jgi:putative oxidoreductase